MTTPDSRPTEPTRAKSLPSWESRLLAFGRERGSDHLMLTYPAELHDVGRLEQALSHLPAGVQGTVECLDADRQRLTLVRTRGDLDLDQEMARLFSGIHRYPLFASGLLPTYRESDRPLVSCVIVLTANDEFVARHLLPSIIQSTAGHPFEIIIVSNGLGCDLSLFPNVQVIESEFGHVARAYNRGAAAGSGRLLAFFHDDCLLDDPEWVTSSLALLREKATMAVTPEVKSGPLLYRTAKCVPLVMFRDDFERLGGFDEQIYIGYEDTEFSYAMYSRGARIAHVPVTYWHFSGMSTILMILRSHRHLKHFFSYHLIPSAFLEQLASFAYRRFMSDPVFALAMLATMKHINGKHHGFIEEQCRTNPHFPAGYLERVGNMQTHADRLLRSRPDLWGLDDVSARDEVAQHYRNLDCSLDP